MLISMRTVRRYAYLNEDSEANEKINKRRQPATNLVSKSSLSFSKPAAVDSGGVGPSETLQIFDFSKLFEPDLHMFTK